MAGAISATLATTANTPFDVVKSRMQNAKVGRFRFYALNYHLVSQGEEAKALRSVFGTLAHIYKHEGGLRGIYKGTRG